MFRKNKSSLEAIQTASPDEASCRDTECKGGSVDSEVYENVLHGEDLEALSVVAEEWSQQLDTSRSNAAQLKEHFDAVAADMRRKLQLTGKAPLQWRLDKSSLFTGRPSDVMAQVREDARSNIDEIAKNELNISYEKLFESKDADKIENALSVYRSHSLIDNGISTYPFFVDTGADNVENPYYQLFLKETIARLELLQLSHSEDNSVLEMLRPKNLEDMSDGMKLIASLDLSYSDKSIIRRYQREVGVEAAGGNVLQNYIERGVTNPEAKKIIEAIQIGARAAGSSVCLFNESGLCRLVTEEIDVSSLPAVVQKDIENQDTLLAKKDQQTLQRFIDDNAVSRWYRAGSIIARQSMHDSGGVNRSAKRAAGVSSTNDVEASIRRPDIKRQAILPSRIALTVNGESHVINSDDMQAVNDSVDLLRQSKAVKTYESNYQNQENIETFLNEALLAIISTPDYRASPGIIPMSYAKKIETANGEVLKVWRLSGRDFQGASGKLARDTRVYFGVSHDEDTRHLRILDVAHKSDVAKSSKSGKLFS